MEAQSFMAELVMRVIADSKANILEYYHRHPSVRQQQYRLLVDRLPGVVNSLCMVYPVANLSSSSWSWLSPFLPVDLAS